MKKFLTVLLVIAVMFTFSFGSAFADVTNTDKAAKLAEAKAVADGIVDTYYDAAMKLVTDSTKNGLSYTDVTDAKLAAAWAKIDVKAQVKADIAEKYLEEAKNNAFTNFDEADDAAVYAAKLFGISTKGTDGAAVFVDQQLAAKIVAVAGDEAVKNLFDADRAAELAKFDKVDYSVYSGTATDAETGKTYLVLAQEAIAKAKADAETEVPSYGLDDYKDGTVDAATVSGEKLTAVKAFVTARLTAQKYAGTSYETGLYVLNTSFAGYDKIKTIKQSENDAITEAAKKAAVKAEAQKQYAEYIVKDSADKERADAYLTVMNYLADAGVVTQVNEVLSVETTPDCKAAIKEVAELKAFAEKYKAEKDGNGAFVRTAAAVDKIVNDTTKYLYAKAQNAGTTVTADYQTVAAAMNAIRNLYIEQETYNLNFAKEAAKAAVEEAYGNLIDDYYAAEAAKIDENKAKVLADIEAADTVAKVETAIGGNTNVAVNLAAKLAPSSIKDGDAVDALTTFGAGTTAKSVLDAIQAYVNYANTNKTVLDASYIVYDETTVKNAILAIYGEAGARTETARKAVTVSTEEVVAKLSTVGGLATAKAAAEDAIKALPATITLADKDAVKAAFDLVAAYNDMNGHGVISNQATLNKAITDLKAEMTKDFAIKTAALDKNDKAAVKALKAEIDEANKLVGADKLFGDVAKFVTTDLTAALTKIQEAEKNAVIAAINAIPINVTEADAAVVKNARALYTAYVEEYTDYGSVYTDAHNATADITNYRELATAEATIGLNNDDASKVEALKITASSTAKKGSITVKWTVKGDAAAADGYQIWKSTKKSSGYKKAFTTTKKSYKNTKGLKKGTRYYYKVRAYKKVDGKMVYSDWSNKAYRKAK